MLSREFLIDRGYCCGHGCLMCPYEPKHTKDNTIMAEQWIDKNKDKFSDDEYLSLIHSVVAEA